MCIEEQKCSHPADIGLKPFREAQDSDRQDRAVDAVIGMESLLLAGLGNEERRGELSYRFSIRYSAQ